VLSRQDNDEARTHLGVLDRDDAVVLPGDRPRDREAEAGPAVGTTARAT